MRDLPSIAALIVVVAALGVPAGLSAQTQGGMTTQACSDYKKAQEQLGDTYNAVLKRHAADKTFVARFKAAQQAWLTFRDAELKAVYPADPATYGSALAMCRCIELTQLAQARTKQLKAWSRKDEGDVCAGSRG